MEEGTAKNASRAGLEAPEKYVAHVLKHLVAWNRQLGGLLGQTFNM